MMQNQNQNKTESDSPALSYQSEHYPSSWHGKVPRRVRLTTRVWSDFSLKFLEVEKGVEVSVWVNSYGVVVAILPNGDTLGLKPYEFEITAWHEIVKESSNAESK